MRNVREENDYDRLRRKYGYALYYEAMARLRKHGVSNHAKNISFMECELEKMSKEKGSEEPISIDINTHTNDYSTTGERK